MNQAVDFIKVKDRLQSLRKSALRAAISPREIAFVNASAADLRLRWTLQRESSVDECRREFRRTQSLLRRDVPARIELSILYAMFVRDDDERAVTLQAARRAAHRFHQRHETASSARLLRWAIRGWPVGLLQRAKQRSPGAILISTRPRGEQKPPARISYSPKRPLALSAEQVRFFSEGVAQQFFGYRAVRRLRSISVPDDSETYLQFASHSRSSLICLAVRANCVVHILERDGKIIGPARWLNTSPAHYNRFIDYLCRRYPFSRSRGFKAVLKGSHDVRTGLAAIDPPAMEQGSSWRQFISDIVMGDWEPELVLLPRH